MNNSTRSGGSAHSVTIFFSDETINLLFSELLEVRGVRTKVIENIAELTGETRIITEPQLFPLIDPKYQNRCLVVGNKDSLKGIEAISLTRPLTEEKIEMAFKELFSGE